MKNIEDSRGDPYDAHTGIARDTRGFLRIIQPNHKYVDVSSRTGPVAWCDHGNSTDVIFPRVRHSALRARNRTGDKNRTGLVVGCDWGTNEEFAVEKTPYRPCEVTLTLVKEIYQANV